MKISNIWHIEAMILTPVIIKVAANNEQEAFNRLMDGAWHGVDAKNYDKAVIKSVGTFTKGETLDK